MRMVNAVNYKNDFALGTWAPLNLCEGKTYHIDIFVDNVPSNFLLTADALP